MEGGSLIQSPTELPANQDHKEMFEVSNTSSASEEKSHHDGCVHIKNLKLSCCQKLGLFFINQWNMFVRAVTTGQTDPSDSLLCCKGCYRKRRSQEEIDEFHVETTSDDGE